MADTFSDGATRCRAKVWVEDVSQRRSGYVSNGKPVLSKPQEIVTFRFVNGNDPDSENAKFWEASPSGDPWKLVIQNPGAQGIFEPGQEYYLDFVEAVRTPAD